MAAAPPSTGIVRLGGLLIGILIFGGLLTYHLALALPTPAPSYTPYPDSYRNMVRALSLVSAGFIDAAVAVSVAFSWHVALARPDFAEGMRRGLLVFAAVFLTVWLVVSSFVFSTLRYL